MEYQRYIRNNQIERAKKILASNSVEKIKKGPNDVTRFIKKAEKGLSDTYVLNEEAIRKEEMFDGFYAIATNIDDRAQDIIKINEQRYKIEDCFRVLKTNFKARPVYHQLDNRIRAHFLICYTALLIYRLLEAKLDDFGTHFTTEEIISTLKNMNVHNCNDFYYEACYDGGKILTHLNIIFGLGLDKQYYLPTDLRKRIKK